MECKEAINQTRKQVINIPKKAKRIVVSVGSGMSLSGILWGLLDYNIDIPVIGICVGADPIKRLNKYAPHKNLFCNTNWQSMVTLIQSDLDYHTEAKNIKLGNLLLDPIYEAKVLPYLNKNDLFWVIGIRKSII